MPGRSIAHRISLLVGLAVLLAVTLVTAVFTLSELDSEFAQRKRSLEATGYVFASALADHVAMRDSQESFRVLRSISRLPEITYAAVIDDTGHTFASFGGTVIMDAEALRTDPSAFEAMRTGRCPVAVDIIKSGNRIGRVILIADVSDVARQITEVLLSSLAVAVLAIAVSYIVARRFVRRITGPITSLTTAIQQIRDTRQYHGRVEAEAEGEARLLLDSFNAMFEEISSRDEALDRHRQTLESTVEQRTVELRHARDAAEQANAAKSSFLATMSHEIRTPLNGLMVMAELLAGAGLDQRLQRYAEVIVKSGQSLLTIINDILDLSKIEAGRLELETIPVSPAGIADDVISLFWEKAASKGIDLAARVAPGVPAVILGDPVRLNQVLSNLVNNALKFTEAGHVLISLGYDKGQLGIAVADSGIGISRKNIDQLFTAFSQADQSITRRFGGSGLGLAISKRMVEAMGGQIGVRSEVGKGSTFWVSIPVQVLTPARKLAWPPRQAVMAVSGPASQSALGTALMAAGFKVAIADRTVGAADIVFVEAPRLPSLALAAGPRPKIVCLSWMGASDGEAAIAEGEADDLILLPLRNQDISDTIARFHAGSLRGRALLERRAMDIDAGISFKGRSVIVADDNAVNREVLIEVLRQVDVAVEVAVNGREAVDRWIANRPDLVFMDCSMPELDGFSATREIRAHEKLSLAGGHTPVVALTAHVAGTDAATWQDAGMDSYITKPFTRKQIVDCLALHFAGKPLAQLASPDSNDTAAGAGGPILDDAVIADLRSIGGGEALFRRVLDLFSGRVPLAVEQVTALANGSDLVALADAAHALKSMCSNIGASRAMAACNAVEKAAREGGSFDAGGLVADIIREVRLVLAEVERLKVA